MKSKRKTKRRSRRVATSKNVAPDEMSISIETAPHLEFWEVVHTRTYAFEPCISLDEMADRLLATKTCSVIISSTGWYCHLQDDKPVFEPITIRTRPHSAFGVVSHGAIDDEFARITLLLSTEIMLSERKSLSENTVDKAKYIRCVFEPFYVEFGARAYRLYPNAKIYDNGICIISLRILCGDEPKSLDDIADTILGLNQQYFDSVLTPESILKRTPAKDFIDSFFKLNKDVHLKHSPEKVGDALFGTLVSIPEMGVERTYRRSAYKQVEGYAMLDTIWETLYSLLDDVAFRPAKLHLKALQLRRSTVPVNWFGHSVVFILKWAEQPLKASEIHSADASVARLVAGRSDITPSSYALVAQPVPRVYEDYRLFVTEGSSVYLASQQLLDNANEADTHYQRVTLPMVSNEELALWMVGSYRALASKSKHARTSRQLSSLRRTLSELESVRSRISQFGDLELMLTEYLSRFRVDADIQSISNSLHQLEQELKDTTNLRIAALGLIATVVFGLLGSAQIAEWIIRPIRNAGIKLPEIAILPQDTSDFVLAGCTLVIVCVLAWIMVLRRTKR